MATSCVLFASTRPEASRPRANKPPLHPHASLQNSQRSRRLGIIFSVDLDRHRQRGTANYEPEQDRSSCSRSEYKANIPRHRSKSGITLPRRVSATCQGRLPQDLRSPRVDEKTVLKLPSGLLSHRSANHTTDSGCLDEKSSSLHM